MGPGPGLGAFASLQVRTLNRLRCVKLTELWWILSPVPCSPFQPSRQVTSEALQDPGDQLPAAGISNGELGDTDLRQLQQEKWDLEQQLREKNKVWPPALSPSCSFPSGGAPWIPVLPLCTLPVP